MTRVFLMFVLFLFWAGSACGQADVIALYSDQSYTDCSLTDGGAGSVIVYVVHESRSGSMASQFSLQAGSGVGLAYVNESSPFMFIGDTQSGITIAYGGCRSSQELIATITYFTTGASTTCSSIRVLPDPSSLTGTIEVLDCMNSRSEGLGGKLVINPDGSCGCGPSSELTSWGKIKDLYD